MLSGLYASRGYPSARQRQGQVQCKRAITARQRMTPLEPGQDCRQCGEGFLEFYKTSEKGFPIYKCSVCETTHKGMRTGKAPRRPEDR
eukprot:g2230.t1